MEEKVDAPVEFKGIVFLKNSSGQRIEADVSFGYGGIPNHEGIVDMIHNVIDMANEQTGSTDWAVVTPQELMETAARKEFGQKVCVPMSGVEYEIYR